MSDIKFTKQDFENACGMTSDSICVLKAEPDKLDIESRKPGILLISLQVGSPFQLAIMTLLLIFVKMQSH